MFSYYGGKGGLVDEYPAPQHGLIIEPFCGSARYACKYLEHDVWINDKYEVIYRIWKYLQSATEQDIQRLPILKHGERLENFKQLSQEERYLLGFMVGTGGVQPHNICTGPTWGELRQHRSRNQVLRIVGKIDHWRITNLDYQDMENCVGTWFVDPPYQEGGEKYRENSMNYTHLREWCESRRGEIIVCEHLGNDWMPENDMVRALSTLSNDVNVETMWHRKDNWLEAYPQVKGIHPVCEMVPSQTDDEYRRLVERIRRNGLRKDIVLNTGGLILDGRHRLRACFETGTEPRFETTDADPREYVTDAITHRSLTAGQRAMIANDMREYYEERARERQGTRTDLLESVPTSGSAARDEAGAVVGVSGRAVDMARELSDHSPELAQEVRDGTLPLRTALEQAKPPRILQPMVADKEGEKRNRVLNAIATMRAAKKSLDLIEEIPEDMLEKFEQYREELQKSLKKVLTVSCQ